VGARCGPRGSFSWIGSKDGRICVVEEVLLDSVFFLTRLPPRFELPRMHSRCSFLHRPHGGVPPETSLHYVRWRYRRVLMVSSAIVKAFVSRGSEAVRGFVGLTDAPKAPISAGSTSCGGRLLTSWALTGRIGSCVHGRMCKLLRLFSLVLHSCRPSCWSASASSSSPEHVE